MSRPTCIHVNAIPKPCHSVKKLAKLRYKTKRNYLYINLKNIFQKCALPQRKGDLITPHLRKLVHVAVRSRFEGDQLYAHTRILVYTRKLYVQLGPRSCNRTALHMAMVMSSEHRLIHNSSERSDTVLVAFPHPRFPHPTPASAVPSTLHGTQAPHPPVPSASAAPTTPGDAAAAGQSAPVAPGEASAAAVPAAANAAAAPSAAVATAPPAIAPPPAPSPPATPCAATAATHSGGATGATRLPPRSERDPPRDDLLLYRPGRPVVVDVCVTHPLASFAVAVAAWGTGVSSEAKDALKRDKYSHTCTVACRFVPLSHETYGRAGPPACALLHELAEFAASIGAVSKKKFM